MLYWEIHEVQAESIEEVRELISDGITESPLASTDPHFYEGEKVLIKEVDEAKDALKSEIYTHLLRYHIETANAQKGFSETDLFCRNPKEYEDFVECTATAIIAKVRSYLEGV